MAKSKNRVETRQHKLSAKQAAAARKQRAQRSKHASTGAGAKAFAAAAARATSGGAAKPAAPAAPTAPARVNPFLTGADLTAINDFVTNWSTQLANVDAGVATVKTDTDYQKSQVESQSKQATGSATDAMIARGLFTSSVKDAALYDIEAQRQLQEGYLNDQLTAATLNAGTQKKILNDSKSNFDKAMEQRKVENAQGAQSSVDAAYQSALEAFYAANPAAAQGAKPPAVKPPAGVKSNAQGAKPAAAPGGKAKQTSPNTASGVGRVGTGPRGPRRPRLRGVRGPGHAGAGAKGLY